MYLYILIEFNLNMNLLLILILLFLLTFQEEKIKFVFQIHRHGARTPVYNLTSNGDKYIDIYKEEWSLPEGELTEIGKRMHYLVGVFNRKKYIDKYKLLSENYNPYEILVKSTDVNRTLMSIYSQLQGLYPHTSDKIDNYDRDINLTYPQNFFNDYQLLEQIKKKYNNFLEQNSSLPNDITIIPVHNINFNSHKIQLYSPDYCPGIKKSYEEGKTSEIMNSFIGNLSEDLLNKLKNISNLNEKNNFLENYRTLFSLMDTIVADIYDDRELNFLKENNVNIKELNETALDFLFKDYEFVNYYNDITSIYSMSPIMNEILFYMDEIVKNNNNPNKVKYLIFSGHDTNIAGFELFNHKIFGTNVEYAYFSQTEYYELFINSSENNYYVRYMRGEKQKFELDYNSFKKKIEEYLWTESQINKFCKFEVVKITSKNLKLATIILSIIDSILIIFLIILKNIIIKKKKKIENDINNLQPLISFKKLDN